MSSDSTDTAVARVKPSRVTADDFYFLYPATGDDEPPAGAKVLALTAGGICLVVSWKRDPFLVAWAPLPRRDKAKEALLEGPHPPDP